VVVEPLQLQQDDAERTRPRGHGDLRQALDRVRVRQCVADRGVAGDRLGQEQAVTPRQPFESLLDPLVHVEQPELKVQHRLAGDAESEVPRLDDSRVHRAHRNLEHAFTGDGSERMRSTRRTRHHAVVREILAQRPGAVRPVVVERDPHGIGMALRNEAEEIHHFAFEPVRDRMPGRDRRKRWFSGVHGRDELQEAAQARQEPQVVQDESALRRPLVTGEERHHPSAQRGGDPIGQVRQRGGRRLEQQLAGTRLADTPLRNFQRGRHARPDGHQCPQTTRVAARMSASRGAGR
jgi:hypothetical protein